MKQWMQEKKGHILLWKVQLVWLTFCQLIAWILCRIHTLLLATKDCQVSGITDSILSLEQRSPQTPQNTTEPETLFPRSCSQVNFSSDFSLPCQAESISPSHFFASLLHYQQPDPIYSLSSPFLYLACNNLHIQQQRKHLLAFKTQLYRAYKHRIGAILGKRTWKTTNKSLLITLFPKVYSFVRNGQLSTDQISKKISFIQNNLLVLSLLIPYLMPSKAENTHQSFSKTALKIWTRQFFLLILFFERTHTSYLEKIIIKISMK